MRATLLVALLLLALPSANASAKQKSSRVIQILGFQMRVPDGWQQVQGTQPQAVFVLANRKTGQVALVSRIVGPNDLENISASVLAGLEQQIKAKAPRYQRISSQRRVFGRKRRRRPAYDLWFRMRRDHKNIVMGTRFLFYPGYTLTLTIDSYGSKVSANTRRLLKSFQPFFPQ